MKNRKSILAVLSILLVISTFAIGSLAKWFTSSDSVTNNFDIGYYEIITNENFNPKTPNKDGNIIKEVTVKNTGTLPAYIRVKIVPYWKNGAPIKYNDIDNNRMINTVELNLNSSKKWMDGKDGFYYYKKILQPGETSEKLLESVTINVPKGDNSKNYSKDNLVVDVFTESIIYKGDMEKEKNQYSSDKDRYNYKHNDKFNEENDKNFKDYFGVDLNKFKISELSSRG